MHKGNLLVITAIIAASALIGLLGSTDTVHATTFNPYYSTSINDRSADVSSNTVAKFGFNIGSTDANFAATVTFVSPDITITPSSSLTIGDITGSTLVSPTILGILNGTCSSQVAPGFTFKVASTDVRDTISPMPEGTFNRIGNLRQDVNPANGNEDYLDKYPAFLNKIFDPDDSDVTGVSPTFPLKPIARYAASTNIAGTDILLQLLIFGKGALVQFQNTGTKAASQQFTEDFGYPSVIVLQDPTGAAAPSTLTDFCAPFASNTGGSGITNPEASLVGSQCDDNTDDDLGADGLVNDGCPKIGVAESGAECANAIDDLEDTPPDGAVNDGCPQVGAFLENPATIAVQCAGVANEDGDASATTAVVNDGCPVSGSVGEHNMCENSADDDDNDFGTFGGQLDGFVNDGCPTVGAAETAGAQCADVLDNDADGFVNDGCVQVGANTEASGCGVGDVDNDDANGVDDFEINDGCPTVPEGESAVNVNPPAGSGLFRTNTHLTVTFNIGLRDPDNDGIESLLDTCPFTANTEDPRTTIGNDLPSGDNIDASCDLDGSGGANSRCGPGAADDNNGSALPDIGLAGQDCDLDNFFNAQDNCPQVANPGQVESESNVPFDIASPDGGSRTDQIGDACDLNPGVADGHYHVEFNTDAICYEPGVDADGDGWCDDTEENPSDSSFLGSDAGKAEGGVDEHGFVVNAVGVVTDLCNDSVDNDGDGFMDAADAGCSTPEHVAVDYQFNISNPGATRLAAGDSREGDGATLTGQCASSAGGVGVDDDKDGAVNDGCVADGAPETGSDCLNDSDDDADGDANDGCPTVNNGVTNTCTDGIDNDQDGDIDQADAGCTASVFPDSDADGVCNSTPAQAGKCILVTGNGASVDGVDNCPNQRNPSQANSDFDLNAAGATVDPGNGTPVALPADTLGNACDPDDDNDSFTGSGTVVTGGNRSGVCRSSGLGGPVSRPIFDDCVEQYLGTDPQNNCPANAADDAWPVDLNRGTGTLDVVDTGDNLTFITMQTAQNLRADFNTDLSVNLFDAFLLTNLGPVGNAFSQKVCT